MESTGLSSFTIRHEKHDKTPGGRQRRHRDADFEFIGVDGEGVTDAFGTHRYVLLGVGQVQIENPDGLSWEECFSFLYDQFKVHPQSAFVGFFLGYDFSQIFRSLPENRARILLTKEGINARRRKRSGSNRKPFPVRFRRWEFDFLPGRRLQLRPLVCDCDEGRKKCVHNRPRWMYICDCGSFWQTSLINVLNPSNWITPICTQEEYDLVIQGKARRASAQLDEDMRRYNRLENELLARAMGILRQGFAAIGIRLSRAQWFGPGQAAAAWMRNNKIPRRESVQQICPEWFQEAARQSYFGGWFEIMSHGIVPGLSYEYDINSAYPHVIRTLPCLLHGRYDRGAGNPPDTGWTRSGYTLVRCRATGASKFIGAALNRGSHGEIRRPVVTEGWYWLNELDSARKAGLISGYEFLEWVRYTPCECDPPLRGVADLYQTRLNVGKQSVLGIAAKLVYNSMYGKFAQSVGAAPYGNWVYASLITSGCRSMITDAIATHPRGDSAVLMVATDAVFFDSPHPGLPRSQKLGEWDSKERSNLTLFKPGVYWDDAARKRISEGDSVGFKARGLNARDFAQHIGSIDERFLEVTGPETIPEFRIRLYSGPHITADAEKGWPDIVMKASFSMTTALQALNEGEWGRAGYVTTDLKVTHTSEPWDKRERPYWDPVARRLRTVPRTVAEPVSAPYEKRYGLEDPFSDDRLNMLGTSQDEMIAMQMNMWRRLLTGEN
jgi:hypothetical protein